VVLPTAGEVLTLGKGRILREGNNIAILSLGTRLSDALKAADELAARGFPTTVADARFAKPIDGKLAERLAREHDLVVTIEENVLPGGFGSAVLEHLEDAFADSPAERARVLRVGLPDRYVTHGKPALLRAEAGLTGEAVAERVLAARGAAQPVAG
jgi:1-deoxy-D-xylulose-5-phosphate synthase